MTINSYRRQYIIDKKYVLYLVREALPGVKYGSNLIMVRHINMRSLSGDDGEYAPTAMIRVPEMCRVWLVTQDPSP